MSREKVPETVEVGTNASTPAPPPLDRDPYGVKKFLSGGLGGMCLVAVGHPFDTTKVKLQTSSLYTSTWHCVKSTFAKEGIIGFYRGMLTPLIFVTPLYAVCFWGYDLGVKMCRVASAAPPGSKLSLAEYSIAGGFSAFPSTVLMTPIERVKVLLQTQTPDINGKFKYSGPVDVISRLLKEGGIRSLYRGTWATLARDVPGSMAYFGAYEFLKNRLNKPGELNKSAILFAGGMAGIANWAVAIPPDVLKSRLQSAPEGRYKGLSDVFFTLIKEEGPAGLFKGFGPIMLRAFPANAACFFGAEISYSAMDKVM